MSKAVIYCRVSTKEQVSNLSLPTQQKAAIEYCKHSGWEVDAIFRDEGESAKTIDRPAFQEMLGYCHKHKGRIEYLVVYNISRFSRNTDDHILIYLELKKLGIVLRSVTEKVDETPSGRLNRLLMQVVADYDNAQKGDRTKAGMKASATIGRWPFKAPLGYRNTKSEGAGNLIPDPEKAPLVRKAFELYATGTRTKQEILSSLTKLGLRSERGKLLTAQSFDNLLRNPIYSGWIVIPTWDMRCKGDFEPLVSQEMFRKVQQLLQGKSFVAVPHKRNHSDFSLRVFVRCASCGEPLTGSWSKGRKQRYAYYRCRNAKCLAVKLPKIALEKQFTALLERLAPSPAHMKLFQEMVRRVWADRQREASALLESAKKQMQRLDDRKQTLVDALLMNRIKQKTYDEQTAKLEVDLERAEQQLSDAELGHVDIDEVLNFADRVLSNASTLWLTSPLDQRQRLQRALFPQGLTYAKDGFGTAPSNSLFRLLEDFVPPKSNLASPTGFEPVLPP